MGSQAVIPPFCAWQVGGAESLGVEGQWEGALVLCLLGPWFF